MTNERDLAISIFNCLQLTDSVSKAEQLILAYADEIRRECADRAVEWLDDESGKDYPAMDDDSLRAAIAKAEGMKE